MHNSIQSLSINKTNIIKPVIIIEFVTGEQMIIC